MVLHVVSDIPAMIYNIFLRGELDTVEGDTHLKDGNALSIWKNGVLKGKYSWRAIKGWSLEAENAPWTVTELRSWDPSKKAYTVHLTGHRSPCRVIGTSHRDDKDLLQILREGNVVAEFKQKFVKGWKPEAIPVTVMLMPDPIPDQPLEKN